MVKNKKEISIMNVRTIEVNSNGEGGGCDHSGHTEKTLWMLIITISSSGYWLCGGLQFVKLFEYVLSIYGYICVFYLTLLKN